MNSYDLVKPECELLGSGQGRLYVPDTIGKLQFLRDTLTVDAWVGFESSARTNYEYAWLDDFLVTADEWVTLFDDPPNPLYGEDSCGYFR